MRRTGTSGGRWETASVAVAGCSLCSSQGGREAIQLNPQGDFELDVAEFSRLVEAQAIEQIEQAMALYQGEFLEGFSVSEAMPFEDWARLKREQLQRSYVAGMHRLVAELHEAASNYPTTGPLERTG